MGVELLEIGDKVRKGVIFTIRGCFRLVCDHPFLVGMLCFLIFLYRSSPFIFQLLVSASPILVCTALLLGTLLSFGQPYIPEIEIEEEKTSVEVVSIKTGVSDDATTFVEKNEIHYVERFSDSRWDEEEKSIEQSSTKLGEVLREAGSDDTTPLIEERLRETEVSDGENMGEERELGELIFKGKSEWIEERLNNGDFTEDHRYHLHSSAAKVNGGLLESDDEKSEADSFDSEKVNVDSLDSPPRSPWARVAERDELEKEEDNEEKEDLDSDSDSDSESDCAESSSPDASMADILPMLDELHPLLDEEGPQTADVESDTSMKSSASSHHHSDDDYEDHDDFEEVADDENEDGEDEEEAQGNQVEEIKSPITWTEQDQKNLMDLGTSEIERNQRLENLILRRRARKSTNLFAERNLIDLESSDLPFNIAPISTRRQNPFDLPQYSYDDMGLPPIPGSAPSVLLQRQNPFDIPYDSSEEKPDLKGDVFQEEFASQSREPVYRRHESFNVGPSIFAPRKQDVKMRPYFVPERTISEESSSSLFQRQSSGMSDSKVSSIQETESITSVEDMEEKKLLEKDSLLEREVVEQTEEVVEELIKTEEEVHQGPEMTYKVESVSEHIGHGSESSEDENYLELTQVKKRAVQVEESQLEDVTDYYEQRSTSQYVEDHGVRHGSNFEGVESTYTRDSSSSSLSEVSERVFIDTEGEGISILEGRRDDDDEPIISTQTSLAHTDLNITDPLIISVSQRAPVYDSSPRELCKHASSSSISSDVLPESDPSHAPALNKLSESSIGEESEGSCREIETETSCSIEMLPDSSVGQSLAAEMEKHLMEKHILDEVSVSIDDENIQTVVESSEDQGLEVAAEKQLLPSEASKTQFEDLPRTEHSNSVDESVQLPHSDADSQHETDEKLISMLSSEGNTSLFYDNAIQESDFNYFNEVQASSTSADVQEIDGYINSQSSPKFISVLPSAIETNSYRFDVQTVVEQTNETNREIDDGLLSELDSIGDFSTRQFGSGTSDFEKHVDSVESSTAQAVGDHSVDVNKSEHFLLLEELREHIDVHEQDVQHTSEIHQTSRADKFKVSELDDNDLGFPYEEIPCDENESLPGHLFVDRNHENMEVRSVEDKAELASVESAAMVEVSEVSCQDRVDTETSSAMHELKASSIDIDLVFKQISSTEIEKHVVLDPPQAELQNHEDDISAISETEVLSFDSVDDVRKESDSTFGETEIMVGIVSTDTTSEMTVLQASAIEDIDLSFKQTESEANKKPLVLEPVDAADMPSLMPELEDNKINSMEIEKHTLLEPSKAESHNYEDTDSGASEQEVLLAEGADAVPKHTESTSVETAIAVAASDVSVQDLRMESASKINETSTLEIGEKLVELEPVDSYTTSGMPEIRASSVEAINQAVEPIGSEEMKNCDPLEPLQPEQVSGETMTESSEGTTPKRDTSVTVSTHEASVLEDQQTENAIIDDKETTDIITGVHGLHEEDAVFRRVTSVLVFTNDSVNHTLHAIESGETQGASSELHVAEGIPSEATALPPNQVLDCEMMGQLKDKSGYGSVEVNADDKLGASEKELEAENLNHDDEAVKDLHSPSSGKGKGKLSRSTSSSSSSSSESSSE